MLGSSQASNWENPTREAILYSFRVGPLSGKWEEKYFAKLRRSLQLPTSEWGEPVGNHVTNGTLVTSHSQVGLFSMTEHAWVAPTRCQWH